jgi:hypothetical protein
MDGGSIFAVMGLRVPSQDAFVAGLREAAHSQPAFVAYVLLALCWTLLFASAQSLRGFASAIRDLPELQRVELLKRDYPAFIRKSLSSQDFIGRRQKLIWLVALLALLLATTVVVVVAFPSWMH